MEGVGSQLRWTFSIMGRGKSELTSEPSRMPYRYSAPLYTQLQFRAKSGRQFWRIGEESRKFLAASVQGSRGGAEDAGRSDDRLLLACDINRLEFLGEAN